MELVRAVDETAMFNQVHGSYIYLAYYPVLSSIAMPASVLSRDSTAYRIDLMTFDPQYLALPIYNLNYVKSTASSVTANNSAINPIGFFADMDGSIVVASDNTTSNIASIPLFSVRMTYTVIFFHRL